MNQIGLLKSIQMWYESMSNIFFSFMQFLFHDFQSLRRQYEEALHEKLGGNRKLAIEMLEKLLLHERFALVMNLECLQY